MCSYSKTFAGSADDAVLNPSCPCRHRCDVAVIGAGLAGALVAAVLGRDGYEVVLVDAHPVYPPDFRVEKFAGDQITILRRLRFLDAFAAAATRVDEITNAVRGRVLDRTVGEHYSITYADIVNVARTQVPARVKFLIGRAAEIEATSTQQRLVLSSGDVIEARLVILATGQGDFLRQKLGITRHVLFPRHSLSFGFNLKPPKGSLCFSGLTYYGERRSDGIDYLSVLPLGSVLRGNLFTFCDHRVGWPAAFRHEPKETLLRVLPGLRAFLPDIELVGKVQLFVMDLSVVENHHREGVVLIGDAFQTSCPAAGTGVSRLLVDVERLCTKYVPLWLSTPGMGAEKIASFYTDKEKCAADRRSSRTAQYRRALALDETFAWELWRRGSIVRRRMLAWVGDTFLERGVRSTPVALPPAVHANGRQIGRHQL